MTKPLQLDVEGIVAAYDRGESVKHIAHVHGTTRRTITSRLVSAGVRIRTMSEQLFIEAAKSHPDERKRRAQAAHDAIRGKPRSAAQKVKTAKTREHRGSMTAYEWQAFEGLVRAGHRGTPQLAVGPYSVDIGFPDLCVAVEVDPGWHASAHKRAQDGAKDAYLDILGWRVVRVGAAGGKLRNLHEAITVLDAARRHPSALRKQRVLWGRLQKLLADAKYDEVATVASLREALHGA